MRLLAILLPLCAIIPASAQQTLHATAAHRDESRTTTPGYAASQEVLAAFHAQLSQAEPAKPGELWLELSADYAGPQTPHLTLRIPLASTGDAYGESRSCTQAPGGGYEPVFTAGLDEKNFVPFRPAHESHAYSFLLNKYLCRALAAPFNCSGHPLALPRDMENWRLARVTTVSLSSDVPSTAQASPVTLTQTGKPFDYARCAVVAPSDGLCCVQHRTTQWHCGGKPSGSGWHQVSGDCFHRETGGSCHD